MRVSTHALKKQDPPKVAADGIHDEHGNIHPIAQLLISAQSSNLHWPCPRQKGPVWHDIVTSDGKKGFHT